MTDGELVERVRAGNTAAFGELVDNGKPMLALESADPAKNRKLSLEVKATIMK